MSLGFNYYSDPYNNFALNFNDSYYNQKDNDIDENIFGTDAFYKIRINNFDFKLAGSYKNQSINSTNLSYGNQSYYNTSFTLGFKLKDIIKS